MAYQSGNWFQGYTKSAPTSSSDYGALRGQAQNYFLNNLGAINAQAPQAPGRVNLGNPMFVGARPTSDYGTGISSVDQLGGANSAFFRNMQAQLQPAFTQQRDLALAQAKEQAGNLTGSGFANALGTTVNRSLGDEQAALANYATQGMGMELQRQGQLSGQANQRNLQDSAQFLQALRANQDTNSQYAFNQGNLDQQRNLTQYQTQADIANQNAGRNASLLGAFGTAGVAPDQLYQQGGVGSLAAPIVSELIRNPDVLKQFGGDVQKAYKWITSGGAGGGAPGGSPYSGPNFDPSLINAFHNGGPGSANPFNPGATNYNVNPGSGAAGGGASFLNNLPGGAAAARFLGGGTRFFNPAGAMNPYAIGANVLDRTHLIGGTGGKMLHGAAIGASIGSVVPIVGTALGAGVGSIVGGAKDIASREVKTVKKAGKWLKKRLGF